MNLTELGFHKIAFDSGDIHYTKDRKGVTNGYAWTNRDRRFVESRLDAPKGIKMNYQISQDPRDAGLPEYKYGIRGVGTKEEILLQLEKIWNKNLGSFGEVSYDIPIEQMKPEDLKNIKDYWPRRKKFLGIF